MKINQPLLQCQPNLGNNLNGHPVIYLQMDWVCGDAWRGPFTQSMAFLGAVVGALVFGSMADHFGRYPKNHLKALMAAPVLLLYTLQVPHLRRHQRRPLCQRGRHSLLHRLLQGGPSGRKVGLGGL